jgi:beta-galactosidase
VHLSDVLSGDDVPAGAEVDLGPWDVRVLVAEDDGATPDA